MLQRPRVLSDSMQSLISLDIVLSADPVRDLRLAGSQAAEVVFPSNFDPSVNYILFPRIFGCVPPIYSSLLV